MTKFLKKDQLSNSWYEIDAKLTKLKIYSGNEHPHTSQNPKVIEISKMNNKNLLRN